MKKLIFVSQSKGGSGKSVLTFLLAEKFKNARIVDMDDATSTTSNQLAYRNPAQVTFLDSENNIDRGLFDDFIESISESQSDFIICDLGASTSEQLPFYLKADAEGISTLLKDFGIDLTICVPLGGADIYKATLSYLEQLRVSTEGFFDIKVFKNKYFNFSESQESSLNDYALGHKLDVKSYYISNDGSEAVSARIKEVLSSGKGVEQSSPISKRYFKKSLEDIEL